MIEQRKKGDQMTCPEQIEKCTKPLQLQLNSNQCLFLLKQKRLNYSIYFHEKKRNICL